MNDQTAVTAAAYDSILHMLTPRFISAYPEAPQPVPHELRTIQYGTLFRVP